jgi:hypothetical protein
MDGAWEEQAGTAIGSVRAALGRGESLGMFVSFVLLTILIGPDRLALSVCELIDELWRTQGMDPALERTKGRAFTGFESNSSHGRMPGALSGSFGLARECGVRSHL